MYGQSHWNKDYQLFGDICDREAFRRKYFPCLWRDVTIPHTPFYKKTWVVQTDSNLSCRWFFLNCGHCKVALHMDSDNDVGTKGKT